MFLFTRGTRLFGLALLTFSAVGCVDNASAPVGSQGLAVAVETLSLGSLLEGPDAFGSVDGLIEDASGRMYIADGTNGEVRAFSPGGDYLFSFGRKGAGPGELGHSCCIAWSSDSLLWIRDGENHRYSAYRVGETSATFVTSRPMTGSHGRFMAPVTFTGEGDLIDIGIRASDHGANELVRFALGGVDEITEVGVLARATMEELGGHRVSVRGGLAMASLLPPFGARQLDAHGPGERWAHAMSSTYEIVLNRGVSVHTIIGSADLPPLSLAEREIARRRMEADATRAETTVQSLPYGIPEHKPPLEAIFFDQRGRLWVELSREEGAPRVADVWGTDGSLEQRVQWPADISLALPGWVGERSALGVRRDSLGVEYVVRLTLGE